MTTPRDLAEQAERRRAAAERRRQQARARPAYRDRDQGNAHYSAEMDSRRLLRLAAAHGGWERFYASGADEAAAADQCLHYIVRQEHPAESVRVQWLRRGGAWAEGFPRRVADPWSMTGRGDFPAAELGDLARVQDDDGNRWFAGRLLLQPKRGTVPPRPLPRPRRTAADILGSALAGD